MKLSDKIAIVAIFVTIVGMIISYTTKEASIVPENNQSSSKNEQISHGDLSPNISGVNGNVNITK